MEKAIAKDSRMSIYLNQRKLNACKLSTEDKPFVQWYSHPELSPEDSAAK